MIVECPGSSADGVSPLFPAAFMILPVRSCKSYLLNHKLSFIQAEIVILTTILHYPANPLKTNHSGRFGREHFNYGGVHAVRSVLVAARCSWSSKDVLLDFFQTAASSKLNIPCNNP